MVIKLFTQYVPWFSLKAVHVVPDFDLGFAAAVGNFAADCLNWADSRPNVV